MKNSRHRLTLIVTASVLAVSLPALAAETPAGNKPRTPASLKFLAQQLRVDNNKGCAIADYNRDGKPDISAGEFWYAGPEFKEAKPVRKLTAFGKDYLSINGEHAWAVDGDGWPDIISGTFLEGEVAWYENPGEAGLTKATVAEARFDRHQAGRKWMCSGLWMPPGRHLRIGLGYCPKSDMAFWQNSRISLTGMPTRWPWRSLSIRASR